MTDSLPHWHLVGAGNMGTLAAWYLLCAGHTVSVVRSRPGPDLEKSLQHSNGEKTSFRLPVAPAGDLHRIDHLLVACKTPYTETALRPLIPSLHDDTLVLRWQNGMGALDGLLPPSVTLIEAVTTSAVKGGPDVHDVVAENDTWWGGQPTPPPWFESLQQHWPGLHWEADLHQRQWQKLVINAVINPLTALYDVPNGDILRKPALNAKAHSLCEEADALLERLDPNWPGHSFSLVCSVAEATANNTSSMRADIQKGAITEIDAINGYLLHLAKEAGQPLPAHAAMIQDIKQLSRHPS